MKSITNMPTKGNGLGTLIENQLAIDTGFPWTLNSIPLDFTSILKPVPHCLDYHYFVWSGSVR